ncbi:MAG: hypothetical protein GY751_10365 [Bacteroidetes bacterium]|jgi:hypothetical protein|nr:hypothetical protein [Bacteroidota bacterium]|tara:strand:- start:5575 stop:5919 length:345 start_codon:yes stop_codon:yes gene_type:complete
MSIFSNLTPIVVVGAMAGGIVAEYVHPHAYGLHLMPSTVFTILDEQKLHIHHWVWGLGFLGLYSLKPFTRPSVNSLTVGFILGAIAQGLSYSTSHLMLYDEEGFKQERAKATEE